MRKDAHSLIISIKMSTTIWRMYWPRSDIVTKPNSLNCSCSTILCYSFYYHYYYYYVQSFLSFTLTAFFLKAQDTHIHTWTYWEQRQKIYLNKKNKKLRRNETDMAADRNGNLTQKIGAHSHWPPLYFSLVLLSFCQCPPLPPFLFFPWNPFHIIKDTQMKWTLRKSGFQQGRGCGGGGWEAESWEWGIGSSRSTPPCYLPPSFSFSTGAHPEGRQSGSGPSTDQYHLRY